MRPPSVHYIREEIHTVENPDRITSLRFRVARGATLPRVDPAVPERAEFPATAARAAANPQLPQQPVEPRSVPDRTETSPRQPAARNPASPRARAIQTSIRCDIPRDHSQENRDRRRKTWRAACASCASDEAAPRFQSGTNTID